MTLDWTLNIGDVIVAFTAAIAAVLAYSVGRKQNRMNEFLQKAHDVSALYIIDDVKIVVAGNEGLQTKSHSPCMKIRNIGSTVIYFKERTYNGKTYPMHDYVLPPVSMSSDAFYFVDLPTNGDTHISFTLTYMDTVERTWYTSGFADLINGRWEMTYSPSKQMK